MNVMFVENELRKGNLWARMANGNIWVLRTNGKTKLWKRDGNRFEVPVKCGLKVCAWITQDSIITLEKNGTRYIVEQI